MTDPLLLQPILQRRLTHAPWVDPRFRRLPGIQPLRPGTWLEVDDAYAAQMALRDWLLDHRRDAVVADLPGAEPATQELLKHVLDGVSALPGFDVRPYRVRRPDGVEIAPDEADPLGTLGRLVQEDFCVIERRQGAHVLTAAVLCFPASWTLAEKMGRPLDAIHAPVPAYDAGLARRVNRLFDAIRVGQGLWRVNVLGYDDPALFQPRPEGAPRPAPCGTPAFVRSERQCLVRLPDTQAVVFSIHTTVVARTALAAAEAAALAEMEGAEGA
ncbi:MAG: DUF3445 domain-containing protein [Alphaproteobacteria bacterium]|nr:MAG: DUF3445 domain-containing protein [Alphaproteobacteria bacterium]